MSERKVEGGLKYIVVAHLQSQNGGYATGTQVKSFDDSLSAVIEAEKIAHSDGVSEVYVARCFRQFKKEVRVVEVSYA